jgi:hypothetical protein
MGDAIDLRMLHLPPKPKPKPVAPPADTSGDAG